MSFFPWSFAPASRQVRRSVRRQRERERLASGEPLEPRLALATGLLQTLVTIVDDAGGNLLDHATAAQAAAVGEGEELVANVRLARRPDRPVTVRLATNDPLEVAPSVGSLRFTRTNWNIPQPVAIRSIADGVADGDQRLAVKLTVETAGRQPLTQRIWIDSRDTGEVSPAVTASGVYRGTLAGGASGSVVARYGANEGTATFRIRAPQVPGFANRVVSVDYAVTSANEVAVLAVRGVAASRVRLDLSYRMGPEGPGLSGTLELRTPAGGRATAMRFSAALVTAGMPQLEGYAASPATSAAVGAAPAALAVGVDGTGWVANEATNAVQRLVRQGGVWTVADTIPVGTAPGAIAVAADGSAWVANTADATIQQILKINGVWTAGSPLAVAGSPTAIAVATDGGIWIATAAADGVQRIAMVGGSPSITATLPFGEAPAALAVGSDGGIWVALAGANAVQRITAAGTGWRVGSPIPVAAGPSSLAAAADGSIWVASAASGSLQQVLRARGAWRTQPALTPAEAPADVAVHPDGSVWVAAGDSLQRFVRSRAGWVAQSPISVGGVIAAIRSTPDGTVLAADAQAGIVTAVSAVPSEVQDLAVRPTGVGQLLLSWEAPATGDPTSYTVTINSGSGPTTYVTASTSYEFSGLSPGRAYTFTVTASNASGTSPIANVRFGQSPINVGKYPDALTTGHDGSIWVANNDSNTVQQITQTGGVWTAQPPISVGDDPTALTTGHDGSIWVANFSSDTVQQITQTGGVWTAQSPIGVRIGPEALTTGHDGSIWVANQSYPAVFFRRSVSQITQTSEGWTLQSPIEIFNDPFGLTTGFDGSIWVAYYNGSTVQQIAQTGGVWTAQPLIDVGKWPRALTTGFDGSMWVANYDRNTVQQITQTGGVWTAQPPISVGTNPQALTTALDGSIWVANTSSNTVQQITQTGVVWTAQPPISVGSGPKALTTGLDGSIWVVNSVSDTVQQIVTPPNAPIALSAVFGPGPGQMTLGWQPPAIDGGSPVVEYTATVAQGEYFQTITTTDLSCVFDGLTLGSGPTYFTVTATNFAGVSKAAGHQVDGEGNTIPQLYTAIGISTDGVPAQDGGFDRQGNTYSWEAMGNAAAGGSRVGNTLGPIFGIGSPNQPSLTWAAGQQLAVSGTGSVLNLAAAAVNGTSAGQTGQHLVLSFSDGSSTTWTQSFSDWLTPSGYAGEAVISSQSYRNTASGGQDAVANYVYGYSYQLPALPAGVTLESITLPNNENLRILNWTLSDPVQFGAGYTGYGLVVGNNNVPNSGRDAHYGFDGNSNFYNVNSNGNALGVTISGPDSSYDYQQIAWSGATFNLGPAPNNAHTARQTSGNNNVVQAKGQTISIATPSGDYSALLMIGAGANGTQSSQAITLTFSDGSTATWTQTFTDWRNNNGSNNNPPPTPQQLAATGEVLVARTNVVNSLGNNQMKENAFVYGYSYDLPAGKTLVSITLPNNQNVGILGIALV